MLPNFMDRKVSCTSNMPRIPKVSLKTCTPRSLPKQPCQQQLKHLKVQLSPSSTPKARRRTKFTLDEIIGRYRNISEAVATLLRALSSMVHTNLAHARHIGTLTINPRPQDLESRESPVHIMAPTDPPKDSNTDEKRIAKTPKELLPPPSAPLPGPRQMPCHRGKRSQTGEAKRLAKKFAYNEAKHPTPRSRTIRSDDS